MATSSTTYLGHSGSNKSKLGLVTSPWTETGVTWSTQPSVGTEIDIAQITNLTQNSPDINITNWVKDWIANPNTNYGMRLKLENEIYYTTMTFCSSDNADVARRPKLLIEYKTYASAGSNGVDDIYVREIGKKRYELSDHLGNVRVVVKDLKNAVLKSAIKKDNFDTGVGNWLAANNYNSLLIENKKLKVSYEGTATTGTGAYFTASVTSGKMYVWKFDLEIGTAPSIRYYATMGSNYMGLKHVNEGGSYTVRFTATTTGTVTLKTEASAAGNYQYLVDNSIFAEEGSFEPEIISAETYYPFGMPMPGRTYNNDQYRFGYNGKENDNEVKGTGNSIDFGARMYDPRLGRWLSLDPLQAKYPSLSPYGFVNNNPIYNIEVDGRYFTGNTASVKAVYAIVSQLASKGDERAIAFKAVLEKMDASDVEFHVQNSSKSASSLSTGKGGSTTFDEENNRVLIDVYTFVGGEHHISEKARTGHELEHGAQFLEGELGFVGPSPDPYLYDQTDENKAFQVQNMITNAELPPGEREKTDKDAKSSASYPKGRPNESTLTPEQGEVIKSSTEKSSRHNIYNYKPNQKQKDEKKETLPKK